MKLITSLKLILSTMIILLFTSCENEPIDNNIPKIIATIDNSNIFDAVLSSAVLNTDGTLIITGTNQGTDEILTLSVQNAAVGNFSLNTSAGTLNSASYTITEQSTNPYKTTTVIDGVSSMIITELDMNAKVVSGTFSFIVNRIKLDTDGNPVKDSNGNPIIETINISNGEYFKIPFNAGIDLNNYIIIEDYIVS